MSGVVKAVKKVFKKVKKFIVPVVATIALGPAGLGLSTTAAGAIGGALGGVVNGGGLEGALLGGLTGGLGGWAAGGGGAPSLWAQGAGSTASGLAGGATGIPLMSAAGTGAGVFGGTTATGLGSSLSPGLTSTIQGFNPLAAGALGGQAAGAFGTGALLQQVPEQATGGFLQNMGDKVAGGINDTLGTKLSGGDVLKGGLDLARNMYSGAQQEAIMEQQAAMLQQAARQADPFQQQRGQAIQQGLSAVTDPTAHPLYQQSLAEAEKALRRRQAAAGGYYSGGALEEAAQLPAHIAAALQGQQVSAAGNVAGAAGGSPATAANLYGQAAGSVAAGDLAKSGSYADLFDVAEKAVLTAYK